jgi:hypothetical protein
MRFGVRPQCDATLPRKTAHFVEVRLEPVQVQHQAWGRQIMDFFHESKFTIRIIHKLDGYPGSISGTKTPRIDGIKQAKER